MERTFREHVLGVAADEGPEHLARAATWLDELPVVVDRWRHHWGLGALTEVPASIHWVGRGVRDDGRGCVLKLAVPGAPQPFAEVHWLRRTAQRSAATASSRVRVVRLLDAEPAAGAQLLELVEPGAPLAAGLLAAAGSAGSAGFAVADDAACEVLGSAARAVRRPAPAPQDDDERADPAGRAALASVRGHLAELFAVAEHRDPRHRLLPGHLVEVAAEHAHHLLDTAAASGQDDVLLHGDLHHDNVLSAADGWVVIDPHGVVGEPAYEVAAAVYNPFQLGEPAVRRAAVRCERLADAAQLPPDRVRRWALVQAVLSAVWSLSGRPTGDGADTGSDGDGGGLPPESLPAEVRHVLAVAERLAG